MRTGIILLDALLHVAGGPLAQAVTTRPSSRHARARPQNASCAGGVLRDAFLHVEGPHWHRQWSARGRARAAVPRAHPPHRQHRTQRGVPGGPPVKGKSQGGAAHQAWSAAARLVAAFGALWHPKRKHVWNAVQRPWRPTC